MQTVLFIAAMAAMLLSPDTGIQAARNALQLWSWEIVPSLFPYMVLCRLLAARLKHLKIPSGLAAACLGLVGGSPSGAAVLAGYSQAFPQKNLAAMCALTGTISPMFLLGTAASWLPEGISGSMLAASHLCGALLSAGLIFLVISDRWTSNDEYPTNHNTSEETDPIIQSIRAIFTVGGCIVFYSVLSSILSMLPGISTFASALIHAVLEISGGMQALSRLSIPPMTVAALIAGSSGFSGISILSQNAVFLKPLGINMRTLIRIALLRAFCCTVIMILLCLFLR